MRGSLHACELSLSVRRRLSRLLLGPCLWKRGVKTLGLENIGWRRGGGLRRAAACLKAKNYRLCEGRRRGGQPGKAGMPAGGGGSGRHYLLFHFPGEQNRSPSSQWKEYREGRW